MRIKRRILSIILAIAIIPFSQFISAKASLALISETSTKETITSGATLEKITRFTNDGWLSINLLRVNLSNPNIKLDVLQNINCLRTRTSTINLAKSNKALAAVNASFFLYGKTSEPGTGTPIGPVVKSGIVQSIDSATNKFDNTFGTFSITKLNQAIFNYWKTTLILTAPTKEMVSVARFNKPYYGHTDYTITDSKYRSMSYGITYSSSDVCEIVVDNGIVTEIRNRKPAVEIPSTGYVITTRTEGGKFLMKNFIVGDPVSLEIQTSPDFKKFNTSVTGGAMLVRNGKIPATFSHSANAGGREARTAVGSSKDGKQLIMMTVDDISGKSLGLTQKELAAYMLKKGAYNALNFDGGGSTTMVSRTQQTGVLQQINMPKEGSQRSVANALGIFSTAPLSTPYKLIVYTSDKNVFVNTSRKFTVKVFDKYMNPISVKATDIKWSFSGQKGSISSGIFRPISVGTAYISASIRNITGKIEVNSLSSPVQLIVNSKIFETAVSKTKQLSIRGKNKNGFYGAINAKDVKWAVSSDKIGTVTNGLFKAINNGNCIIDASVGKTHTFALASVPVTGSFSSQSTAIPVIPKDTPITDSEKRYVAYKKSSSSLIFSVFGNISGIKDSIKKALTARLIKTINSSYDFGGFLNTCKSPYQNTIKKQNISTDCGYKAIDIKNSRFIQLDLTRDSLRLSKSAQWHWFMEKIKYNRKNNVFIFLSHSVSDFCDSKEATLFRDFLSNYKQNSGKKIWVFYKGAANSSFMEGGIKYISTAGFLAKGYSSKNKSAAKYALVKVIGNSITYGFKSI